MAPALVINHTEEQVAVKDSSVTNYRSVKFEYYLLRVKLL